MVAWCLSFETALPWFCAGVALGVLVGIISYPFVANSHSGEMALSTRRGGRSDGYEPVAPQFQSRARYARNPSSISSDGTYVGPPSSSLLTSHGANVDDGYVSGHRDAAGQEAVASYNVTPS